MVSAVKTVLGLAAAASLLWIASVHDQNTPAAIPPEGHPWNDLDLGTAVTASALKIEANGNVYMRGKLIGALTEAERKTMQDFWKPKTCPQCKVCPGIPDYRMLSVEARI